jgi:hypothetical protein
MTNTASLEFAKSVERALKRAQKRAREVARQHGTPIHVMRHGKVVALNLNVGEIDVSV